MTGNSTIGNEIKQTWHLQNGRRHLGDQLRKTTWITSWNPVNNYTVPDIFEEIDNGSALSRTDTTTTLTTQSFEEGTYEISWFKKPHFCV